MEIQRGTIRQHVVCDNDVRPRSAENMLGIVTAFCFVHLVALQFQEISDAETHSWLIINYQDSISAHRLSPSAGRGNLATIQAPPSGLLPATSLPPCSSM